jgi:hypothetical protein
VAQFSGSTIHRGATSGPALAYDLAFPEVFYPTGVFFDRQGFHAVLGNPPWDAIQFKSKEFFASYDFDVLAAPTKREREAIEERLTTDPEVKRESDGYVEYFEQLKRANDRLYEYQKVEVEGDLAGRQVDAFRVFMERKAQLLRQGGYVGVVVPSAFHANEGATGVRQLYLTQMAMLHCYSFENRRQLFEIHRSFKFANVVSRRDPNGTKEFHAAFYLHDDEWLFRADHQALRYTLSFVSKTGGEYLSFLELRSGRDLNVADACFADSEAFGKVCDQDSIRFAAECHMTNDAWRFTPSAKVLTSDQDPRDPQVACEVLQRGFLVLQEGKTFRQYDDHWGERPRYLVALLDLSDKPNWQRSARFYRAAYRNIAEPGDQNVAIWNVHPPGVITGEKGPSEATPEMRPNWRALLTVGVFNSHVTDWLLQLRVRATVSQFMLHATPWPRKCLQHQRRILIAHSTLRLTCNHSGYGPLWREQLGDTWRDRKPPFTWPVLATDDERWEVRAAIDAVVADAYGLDREQYAHVLSTFSHKSYPQAPALCLAKFDELKRIGLDAFTKNYDPYWDIPLNESLPQPVIELPIPAAGKESETTLFGDGEGSSGSAPKRRSTRKR